MNDSRNAITHALVWVALTAIPLTVGAVMCLQFPIFTEPFTTPERPYLAVTTLTIAAWFETALCEITLAVRNPHRYPTNGPVGWLLLPGLRLTLSGMRRLPGYATQLIFYLFLFAFFPLLTIFTTTAVISWLWVVVLLCASVVHMSFAIRQDRKWKGTTV